MLDFGCLDKYSHKIQSFIMMYNVLFIIQDNHICGIQKRNRSIALILGGRIKEESNNNSAVFEKDRTNLVFQIDLYDFRYNNWKGFPSFPIDSITDSNSDGTIDGNCAGIISKGVLCINKLGKR